MIEYFLLNRAMEFIALGGMILVFLTSSLYAVNPAPRPDDDAGSTNARSAGSPRQYLGYVSEPAKKVPVLYDVDVVVCGGGISGTMAAIAAGRQGAKTVVIDRFGRLGGNIGPGLWGGGTLHLAIKSTAGPEDFEAFLSRVGMGGIPEEFVRRVTFARPGAEKIPPEKIKELQDKHFNVFGYRLGYGLLGSNPDNSTADAGTNGFLVDSQLCSYVADQMMQEVGVIPLLSCYVADPILEGSTVRGVFVETKSGRVAVKAKVVIDATGEADVCARAGVPVIVHTSPNLGLFYVIGGVDWNRYHKENGLEKYKETLAKANAGREFVLPRPVGDCQITLGIPGKMDEGKDLAGGRTGTVGTVDFSDAATVSLMEREHRRLVVEHARFVRKYVPGFEASFPILTGEYLMARGGRYIDGEYRLTMADLEAQRKFDDVIYVYHDDRKPKQLEIPYRTLVPKKIDGMLACGRAAFVYGPNFRMRCSVMLSGQAAGVAAALAIKEGVAPRKLNVRKLQAALLELRCPIGTDQRLQELKIK